MARVYFGGGVVNILGKLGGSVFQGTNSGTMIRTLSIPTNPVSTTQTLARGKMTVLAHAWNTLLTAAQRLAWEAVAPNVSTDKLTANRIISNGRQYFNKINRIILGAGGFVIIHPPVGTYIGPLENPVLTVDSVSQTIILSYSGPVIGSDYVLQLWSTQPFVASNMYAANVQKFTANFTTPTSPIDFTTEWVKVHGGWDFVPGCVVYCAPYIVNLFTGDITQDVILSAIST